MKIPKIIHQIWIQGENNLPDNFLDNLNKIKNMHKKWQYILWDEIKILQLLQNNKKIIDLYYKFEYLHQKVDYAKLLILYAYGGVCIDMDAYTIKPLDDIIEKYSDFDFVVSNLKDHGFIGNLQTCGKLKGCINNGNFFGKQKAHIVKYIIEKITNYCYPFDIKMSCIQKTTGPQFFNKIIDEYIKNINKSKVKFLDYKILEPCLMDFCDISDDTIIVHKHAGTWVNSFFKNIGRFYLSFPYLVNLTIFLFIILVIYYIYQKIKI